MKNTNNLNNKDLINKKTKVAKFKADIYKDIKVWRATFQVASTGFIMALFLGLFTFVDQLMLVNFMPNTEMFNFDHLFFQENDTFRYLLSSLSTQDPTLYKLLVHTASQAHTHSELYNFVYTIGNLNGVGIYNSDSIVRSAVSLTVALSDIVFILPELISIGVSIFYGFALGKNDKALAISVWRNGFYGTLITTGIGVAVVFLLIPFVTPAQSVINNISNSDISSNLKELTGILTNAGYNTSNISFVNSNNYNETISYLMQNNTVSYYLTLGNDKYLLLNNQNLSLLSLNATNVSDYVVTLSKMQIADLKTFTFSSNDVVSNWNTYFDVTRNYSINWAEDFLYIINSGLLILCLTSLFGTILRADGILKLTTAIVVTAVILNIVLDYILIVYAQIGMDGAACASLFGWTFQILIFVFVMWYSRSTHYLTHTKKHRLKVTVTWMDLKITPENKHGFLSIKMMGRLMLNGGAVFVGSLMYMISDILLTNQITTVATHLLGNIGSEYFLSILGAVLPIVNLFISAILGLLQYTSPMFSINYGANNYKRFQHAFWWTTFYAIVAMCTLYGIICFIPACTDGILGWFNITLQSPNNELLSSVKLLRIWFLQTIAFGMALGNYLSYLGSGRVGWAAMFNSSRGIIIIIVLYIFSSVVMENDGEAFNVGLTYVEINNPYTNNAMWFFMWNSTISNLISGFIMMVSTIWFIYMNIPYGKKKVRDHYPFKWFVKNTSKQSAIKKIIVIK